MAIGVSNVNAAQLGRAMAVAEVASVQNRLPAGEARQDEVLAICERRGHPVPAVVPARRRPARPRRGGTGATGRGTPAQRAIAWLLRRSPVMLPIPGTSSVAHLEENVAAVGAAGGGAMSRIGLGCMGMSEFYGDADEAEAIATIHRALDLGVAMLDTADSYGRGHNERLVGRAIAGRDDAVVATKFGIVRGEDGSIRGLNGRPEYVARDGPRLAGAPRRGADRPPLLPSPRPRGAAGGDRRRDGAAGGGGTRGRDRAVGGHGGAAAAGARRPPGRRRPVRVLALVARPRGRGAPGGPRAGHPPRGVQPRRPRDAGGRRRARRGVRRGRPAPQHPALPGRQLRPQPASGGRAGGDGGRARGSRRRS